MRVQKPEAEGSNLTSGRTALTQRQEAEEVSCAAIASVAESAKALRLGYMSPQLSFRVAEQTKHKSFRRLEAPDCNY